MKESGLDDRRRLRGKQVITVRPLRRRRHFRRRSAAFTLLELITVISGIAILALCVFASVQVVQTAAWKTQCIGRLRNVNQAILAYAEDHDGRLPASQSAEAQIHDPDGIWYHYREIVSSYVGLGAFSKVSSTQLFACPLDHELAPDYPSYLFNGGNEYDETMPGLAGKRLAAVEHPSRTILVAEAGAFHPYSWHSPQRPQRNYNGAQNVVSFCDGHASFIPIYFDGALHEYAAEADPPPEYSYQWSNQ